MNDSAPPEGSSNSPDETPQPDDSSARHEDSQEPVSEGGCGDDAGGVAPDHARTGSSEDAETPRDDPAPDGWSTAFELGRWKAGDEAGFEALHERFAGLLAVRVRGHRAWPLLQARHQVQDLVQEVWGQVVEDTRRSFTPRGAGSFLAWLASLVEHRLIDQTRRDTTLKRGDGVRPEDLDEVLRGSDDVQARPAAVETPTGHARRSELEERIAMILGTHELEAWELRQQGYSFAEIGFAMRFSESAARGLFGRARQKIIAELGGDETS